MKHSRLGIAAFALSLVAGIGLFGLVAIVMIQQAIDHPGHFGGNLAQVLGLLWLCLVALLNLAALGLGIAGLVQADRKKLFAILGVGLASLQLLSMLLFLVAVWSR